MPLHHGYFLWPLGLIAGAVSARGAEEKTRAVPRRFAASALAVLALLTAVIVHDYFKVEAAFTELRFRLPEWAAITTPHHPPPFCSGTGRERLP